MALESATYITDLVATNPTAADLASTADDHLRLIKAVLLATFPNLNGAVSATDEQMSFLAGVTSAIQTQLDSKVGGSLGNTALSGAKTVGFYAEYDNGNSGAAKTITLTNGQKQKITLNSNTTLTIDKTSATVGTYQIRLIQDATGGRTLANISGLSTSRWIGATSQPSHNTAASGETIISIYYDGTNCTQSLGRVGMA